MIALFMAVSMITQVNLFPPIQPEQDFLRIPRPPRICTNALTQMQYLTNGIIVVGGGVTSGANGAVSGFIGGHFDPMLEQRKSLGIMNIVKGSFVKPLFDIMPLSLRSPCS